MVAFTTADPYSAASKRTCRRPVHSIRQGKCAVGVEYAERNVVARGIKFGAACDTGGILLVFSDRDQTDHFEPDLLKDRQNNSVFCMTLT